jgi:hypothetical protein
MHIKTSSLLNLKHLLYQTHILDQIMGSSFFNKCSSLEVQDAIEGHGRKV